MYFTEGGEVYTPGNYASRNTIKLVNIIVGAQSE